MSKGIKVSHQLKVNSKLTASNMMQFFYTLGCVKILKIGVLSMSKDLIKKIKKYEQI